MDNERFNRVFHDQMKQSEKILVRKADEYASDDERLWNFHQAARLQGITPIQALGGFLAKHTVSIYDMIAHHDERDFDAAMWDEKITDHINYLILLKALVQESIWGNEDPHQPPLDFVAQP